LESDEEKKSMAVKKVWCSVVEAPVYSDRCLFKLSKIIEGNKSCENCILRELEKLKLQKASVSDMSNISDRRKGKEDFKRRPKKRSKSLENETAKQMYSTQELSKLLRKSERTIQDWAQEGWIPAHKISGSWHFLKEEIDRWLSERKGGALGSTQSEERQELPGIEKGDSALANQGKAEKST
jgi:excisionase family DNA binding protein